MLDSDYEIMSKNTETPETVGGKSKHLSHYSPLILLSFQQMCSPLTDFL